MTLEITVRGSAEHRYPAETAVVSLAAAIEGDDKTRVFADAVAIQEPLTAQLRDLVDLHAVLTWSSEQVRVFSHRPWDEDGGRATMVHVARVHVQAEFTDFERLSGFLDYWAGTDGVEIGPIAWDVTAKNRRAYEAEVRKLAVDDAIAKAQTYANVVRRGKVTAQHIADAGMLPSAPSPDPAGGSPIAFARSADASGGGPRLGLAPEEIVIGVDVDARFHAE
jgi:uncharacterized protein YggE